MSQGYGPPGQPPYPQPPQASYPYPHPGGHLLPPQNGPTNEERSMAMLAHVLSIFSSFIAPLVIYLAKRKESRFVAFHALQALLWHVLFMASFFLTFILLVIMMDVFGKPFPYVAVSGKPPRLPAFPLELFLIWAAMMLLWCGNLACSVYLGVRASNGHWSRYPIVGWLVQRFGGYGGATNAHAE